MGVDEFAGELMRWMSAREGPLAYLILGLAALTEYVFPPFPGDTVALLGIFLAATGGWSVPAVYCALNVGALAGGMIAYALGRWVADRGSAPAFLRGARTEEALAKSIAYYRKYGVGALALNRFIPAFRALFFVAAGLARLPAWKVALFGGLSACAWNAMLLALGWTLGTELDRLTAFVRNYTAVAVGVIALVAVALVLWALVRRRSPA